MWHPDALDTFDDHLSSLSHFADGEKQFSTGADDLWVTSITISHWRLQNEIESKISGIVDVLEKKERKQRLDEYLAKTFGKHKRAKNHLEFDEEEEEGFDR